MRLLPSVGKMTRTKNDRRAGYETTDESRTGRNPSGVLGLSDQLQVIDNYTGNYQSIRGRYKNLARTPV